MTAGLLAVPEVTAETVADLEQRRVRVATAWAARNPDFAALDLDVDDPRVAAVEWERGLDCPDECRVAEDAYERGVWS